jgi:hypothetical protein
MTERCLGRRLCSEKNTGPRARCLGSPTSEKTAPAMPPGLVDVYFKLLARSGCADMALVNALSIAAGVDSPD